MNRKINGVVNSEDKWPRDYITYIVTKNNGGIKSEIIEKL